MNNVKTKKINLRIGNYLSFQYYFALKNQFYVPKNTQFEKGIITTNGLN